jgi:hypothetical protein
MANTDFGCPVANSDVSQPERDSGTTTKRCCAKALPRGCGTSSARCSRGSSQDSDLAFETRNACDADWERQHPDANVPPYILKPPGFYEVGLFSGGDERGEINGAVVESTKVQAHSSYLVYVNVWSYLDGGEPSLRTGKIYRWRVAARVTSENGKFVVDDILGLKGVFDYDKAVYMSKMLTIGCKGSHAILN